MVALAAEQSNMTSVYTSVVTVVVTEVVAVVVAEDVAVVAAVVVTVVLAVLATVVVAVLATVVVTVLEAVVLIVLAAVVVAVVTTVVDADDTSQPPVVKNASGSDAYAANTLLMLPAANSQVVASGATANPMLHPKMSSELPTGVFPPSPYGPEEIRAMNAKTESSLSR